MAETKYQQYRPETYTLESFTKPEEDGAVFDEPVRKWQTTAPDAASLFEEDKPRGILDKDKREAFVSRTEFDLATRCD